MATQPESIHAECANLIEQVERVRVLHSKRVFDGDGYGWAICVEDRQAWPCATVLALGGEGKVADENG